MNDLLTETHPTARIRRPDLVPAVVIAVVLAVVFVVVAMAIRPHPTQQLTVTSEIDWQSTVRVRPSGGGGWTDLGVVDRGESVVYLEVPDQGASWEFEFTYAGETADLVVTRDAMSADGWVVKVPADLGDQLAEAGVVRTPSSTTP